MSTHSKRGTDTTIPSLVGLFLLQKSINVIFFHNVCNKKAPQQVFGKMMTGIEEDDERNLVFMVSDLSDQQMSQMEEAIVKLGGRMTSSSFDPLATHLITGSVAPTEKKVVLSAASGLWLLHPSFVTESLSQERWVEEENFEWGNEVNGFLEKEGEVAEAKEGKENEEVKLATAARHWRENLRIFRDNRKAFSGMKAMLVMPDEKKITMRS